MVVVLIIVHFQLSIVHLSAQTLVYLEKAETLEFDEERLPGAQLLKGDVMFRHEDAFMYCDSAYFYDKQNSLDAFGNVRFVQGDTLFGYSDYLFYDGNTKFARMRDNVSLVDRSTVLITDSLNYDRVNDLAWYWTGGQIKDSLNVLTSVWGQYISNLNQALFKTDVHLVNDRFVMDADTLKYNTQTHIADILGPTKIIYEKETTITSTLGWYNTDTEESMLLNRSLVVHSDGKSMIGDTIFYDKKQGYGRALRQMELCDSVQHITLYGNYGEMYEAIDTLGSHGYATDSALMVDWSDSTAFTYMHADTLFNDEILSVDTVIIAASPTDSLSQPDTLYRDTSYQLIRGYYGARLYREDLQAVADSAVYITHDSIMKLYGHPIAWSDNQQISADHIDVYMKDSTVDYAHGVGNCIAIQQQTLKYYNQMAGKEMYAYIRDGELRQVDVSGNAETVFYPQDEQNGEWMGVNKTQSSFVKLYIKDQKVDHVVFTTATTGTFYPLDQISESESRLGGFFWAEDKRPLKPGDVFNSGTRSPRIVGEIPAGEGLPEATPTDTPPIEHRSIDKNDEEEKPKRGLNKLRKRN